MKLTCVYIEKQLIALFGIINYLLWKDVKGKDLQIL